MKNERRYCVYMLRFSATGEPFYIGRGLPKRPKRHKYPSERRKNHPKNDILNNFDTYYTIEKEGLTNDEANAYEKELIALWGFENLTNLTRGGSGTDDYRHSKETRAKISEANSGRNCYWFGKSHSKKTRAKISENRLGKYCGENNYMYGKTGKNHPTYDTTIHNFQHKDGRSETCTQYELRTKYNLYHQHLSSVVHGKRRSTGGWSLRLL